MMKLSLLLVVLSASILEARLRGSSEVGNKADRDDDAVLAKLLSEVRGINSKLSKIQDQIDSLEGRFNKTQEAPPTTTTPSWMRYKMNAWQQATTTKSPEEICLAENNFVCYNETATCVKSEKRCDGVADCSDESDECFCKSDAPEAIISRPKECPHGYYGSKTLQKCYWFSTPSTAYSWVEALIDCTRRDAKLVAVESRLEQEAIERFLKAQGTYTNTSLWLGATNILRTNSFAIYSIANSQANSQWKWVANERLFSETGYSHWIKAPRQQPDNTNNMEYCLEMRDDFQWYWNDMECRRANPYICEIRMPEGQRQFEQPSEDEVLSDQGEEN